MPHEIIPRPGKSLGESFAKIIDDEKKLPPSERKLHNDLVAANEIAKKKRERDEAFEPNRKPIKKFKGSYVGDHHIVEQIFNNGHEAYAIYNSRTQQVLYSDHWQSDDGHITFFPIADEEVTKQFMHLPSEATEYGSDEQLITEIKTFITYWLDIPEQDTTFATYNILKSWVYQRFHSINYLAAQGDYGSGKSRYLDTIGLLHRQAFKTTGTATPAALFRVLNKWDGPTLLMDEADMKESDETVDTIKIINQGYEAGNSVIRCDPNDATKIEFHNVYCPKVLGKRKEFADKAVESRCFTTFMRTTGRKNIPPNLNERFFSESLALRNKLLMWKFRNYYSINPAAAEGFDFGDIEPRLKQISTSFVALFANKPKELAEFKAFILKYQEQLKSERSESWEGQIVTAIVTLYTNGIISPTATQIVECAGLSDSKGNPYKGRAISATMKRLGFGTAKLKRDGNNVGKFYKIDGVGLIDLARLYCDDVDLMQKLCNRVTLVTPSMEGGGVPPSEAQTTLKESVTNVTTVTPNPPISRYKGYLVTELTSDLTATDEEVLDYLRTKNKLSQPVSPAYFVDRYGEDKLERMMRSGLIFQSRLGELRVLE